MVASFGQHFENLVRILIEILGVPVEIFTKISRINLVLSIEFLQLFGLNTYEKEKLREGV